MTAQLTHQQRHESPELEAMVGRMFNALIRRCAEGDQEAVEALANLEQLARQALTSGLSEGRREGGGGYSNAELAAVVGTSRQAVSQRTAGPPTFTTAPCDHHGCVGMRRCRIGVSAAQLPPTTTDTVTTDPERNHP